jgi:inhibitor of KinA sporulation pathway (predicted exonuclease)
MKVYGKIHKILKRERIISIVINSHLEFFHMTNKNMKDFKTYLFQKPYVFMEVSEEYSIHNYHKCREIESFLKISLPTRKGSEVFYDISIIQDGVKALINRPQNRLFIDLEFSLNSPLSRGVSEIVQYGLILEDADGNILMEDASLVRPFNPNALNVKTLLFLSRSLEDFDNACSYIEFYQLLKNIIEEYDPKIFAWGKNDILAMENSFKVNHLRPLDIRNRYINLMHVIKNYYSYKQEKGLFATYQEMTNTEETDQVHDALEDALIEREIFYLFKRDINKK